MSTTAHPIIYSNTVEDAVAEFRRTGWYIHNTVHDLLIARGGVFSSIKEIHLTDPDPNITETSPHITVVFIDYSKIAYYYTNPSRCGFQYAEPEPISSGRGCKVEKTKQISNWFLSRELLIPRSYLLCRLTEYLDYYRPFRELRRQLPIDAQREQLVISDSVTNYRAKNYDRDKEYMVFLKKAEYRPEWQLPEFIKDLIESAIKDLIESAPKFINDLIESAHSACGDRTSSAGVTTSSRSSAGVPTASSDRERDDLRSSAGVPTASRDSKRDMTRERRDGGRKLSTRKLSTRKLSTRKLSKRKLSKRKLSKRKLSKRKH